MSLVEVEQNVVDRRGAEGAVGLDALDERLLDQLVGQARERGVRLAGEGGLLQALTKRLLESALEGEIADHLGYEKYDGGGDGSGNSRNGRRLKTVLTDVGPVQVEVPRDRAGSFEPQIVKKRQRRLSGVDEMVLALGPRADPRGDLGSSGRGLRRREAQGDDLHFSPTRSSRGWRPGRAGRWTRSIR